MAYLWAAIGIIAIIVAVVKNPGLVAVVVIGCAIAFCFPPAAPFVLIALILLWWFK